MSNKPNPAVFTAKNRSSLSSLQPVDEAPFKTRSGLGFIWLTIVLSWMLSLLPWRLLEPIPDPLLLVIVFWCLHEPERVSLLTAFVFGLLMDVHDAGLLGAHALTYTLTVYGTLILSRRILRFNVIVQVVHLIPVFIVSYAATRLAYAWLLGEWSGWIWLVSAILTVLMLPVAELLLLMPQRRQGQTDSSAA